MPTPYAYTQWCFSCENVKRHEVARRAISLGGRAIAHHGKMAKKPPEELIIPWSLVRIQVGPRVFASILKQLFHGRIATKALALLTDIPL
jgi:hypothetical protein